MRIVDLETWERHDVYNLFAAYAFPYTAGTINIPLYDLEKFTKSHKLSYYLALVFLSTKAANQIKEMRYRITQEGVAEYEVIHPSYTILDAKSDLLFCAIDYVEDFAVFCQAAVKQEQLLKQEGQLHQEKGEKAMLYHSIYPWGSFTSLVQPVGDQINGSIPRILFGKAFTQDGKRFVPVAMQVHHGLMDGYHMARYAHKLEKMFKEPELHLL